MNMMLKGQVKRSGRSDAPGQAKFVESLFRLAAQIRVTQDSLQLKIIFGNTTLWRGQQ